MVLCVQGIFPGKQGGKTEGATVHVSILYDLGKKVPDEYASQMRLKVTCTHALEC